MLFQKKSKNLIAVATGKVIPLSSVPDDAFSSGLLGEGFAIDPRSGTIYAPIDGKIESITDSLHAYTILSDDGLDVLIHIGIDTVELKGEGFLAMVKIGDRVKAGDVIARVDLNLLRGKNYPAVIPVVISNPEMVDNQRLRGGEVNGGTDAVLQYKLKEKVK